jgi:hypothetical protein
MKYRLLLLPFLCLIGGYIKAGSFKIEKWKPYEISVKTSCSDCNPFDVEFGAVFNHKGAPSVKVTGFYDGNGIFKVRFMPTENGVYTYTTVSKLKELNGKRGSFEVSPPSKKNHGMVHVADSCHFAYSDGTRYFPFGTTCYAWVFQPEEMKAQTIRTLSYNHFNKIRMCIFPKWYDYNHEDPPCFPFEGTKDNFNWDRFVPAYFQNIERCIQALDSMGIEADLIIFHPYDNWGFKSMSRTTDDRYIKYIIARFAAYKNVWWSMANEYDLIRKKKAEDWQHYLEMFATTDPYNHLRSIHCLFRVFDYANPLISHACIQAHTTEEAGKMRLKYHKPIIYDECRYEGDLPFDWGCLTGEAELDCFWKAICTGGYAGHSEAFINKYSQKDNPMTKGKIWWSHGGILKGESPDRIKFLRSILETASGPLTQTNEVSYSALVGKYKDEYFLLYYDRGEQHSSVVLNLPENKKYRIEAIDIWNMKIIPIDGIFSGKSIVSFPVVKSGLTLRISEMK